MLEYDPAAPGSNGAAPGSVEVVDLAAPGSNPVEQTWWKINLVEEL
jgi:hypothetical protein